MIDALLLADHADIDIKSVQGTRHWKAMQRQGRERGGASKGKGLRLLKGKGWGPRGCGH